MIKIARIQNIDQKYSLFSVEPKTIDELQSVAVYARDRINPFLFNYALSVTILHRSDTKDLNVPLFVESFPEKFLDSKIFARIREEAFLIPEDLRKPIEVPKSYTASDDEIEHKLWYFREDIGVSRLICSFGIFVRIRKISRLSLIQFRSIFIIGIGIWFIHMNHSPL